MLPLRRLGPSLLVAAVLATLAGCAPAVSVEAAEDAANPLCAEVSVRLPETVAGLPSRETSAQATGAWGEPAGVILRCGVAVPGPSEADCVSVEGVDWLRDASDENLTVFTSYGRDPAIEVAIDAVNVSGQPALSDLASAVGVLEQTRACLARTDVIGGTPSTSPSPGG